MAGRKGRARALGVWVNGVRAAEWRIPSRGEPEFQYSQSWVDSSSGRALSLSLPFSIDNAPIKGNRVTNYFDNLLPDSDTIRRRIQARYRVASRDPFDLLTAIGRECVGAVQLLPEGEGPKGIRDIDAESLTEAEIERTLRGITAPGAPADADDGDLRISIAGAQEKTAFLRHRGRWCRPRGATPTSHIFKLPMGLIGGMQLDMTASVENEFLCSRILQRYGIPIANCALGQFGEQKVLIVERFDRQLHSSRNYWVRLVQEDFCQALGLPHTLKYERDGGPGVPDLAAVLRNSERRDQDLEVLIRAQVLFWMLAAGDGHAKNFSISLLPEGRFRLAPLYDVLSFWPIIGRRTNQIDPEKVRLAMAVQGKNKHYLLREVRRKHFSELAKRCGLGRTAEPIITDLIGRTPGVIQAAQADVPRGFPQVVLDAVLGKLESAAQKLERMPA